MMGLKFVFSKVGSDQSHCQDIRVPLCQSLPYNQTVMPNLMGNANQQDAQNDINQVQPLTLFIQFIDTSVVMYSTSIIADTGRKFFA